MSEYSIRLHGMPPGPNDRASSRHKAARDTRHWRSYARTMAEGAGIPELQRAKLSATFFRRNLGVADEDNDHARLKPIVDGLRDAKVLRNDNRRFVVWGPIDEAHGEPGVVVRVESLALRCDRCWSDRDDVAKFSLGTAFCLNCYAKLVGAYVADHQANNLEEWLQSWLERKAREG